MRWPALYYLNYSNNRISGTLPVFRSFPALHRFSVANNLLSGTIPAEFGSNWESLQELQLNQNTWSVDKLTGAFGLDSWFGKLTVRSICVLNMFSKCSDTVLVCFFRFATSIKSRLRARCPRGHCMQIVPKQQMLAANLFRRPTLQFLR